MLWTSASARAAVATAVLMVFLVAGGLVPSFAIAAPRIKEIRIAAIKQPTALAFTPGGDLYAASKGGTLHFIPQDRIARPSTGTPRVALNLSANVCSDFERGLLGVAIDPAFAQTRFVYLYYTLKSGSECVNRVSRFKAQASGTLDPESEDFLLENIPSPRGNHNAGDLQFGGDGNLYVAIGDGGSDLDDPSKTGAENGNARRLDVLLGKIVRIEPNGDVPSDNPFAGDDGAGRCSVTGRTDEAKCEEIWATGLRNPFRIVFNRAGTRLFINDVGQQTWEEINQGEAGADYGWNVCEGRFKLLSNNRCDTDTFKAPRFSYRHPDADGGISITGGAVVPQSARWPKSLRGRYLFGDISGGIRVARRGMTELESPVIQAEGPIHLVFKGAALYYSDIKRGGIFRVVPE